MEVDNRGLTTNRVHAGEVAHGLPVEKSIYHLPANRFCAGEIAHGQHIDKQIQYQAVSHDVKQEN